MSTANNTRVRQPYVVGVAVIVCVILPMIVSSQQAGRFFQGLGTGTDSTILFMTACAIIFSSPTIAVLISQADNDWQRCLGWLTCALIMGFSVITTTIAINNKTGDKIADEQMSSATNTTLQSTIDANLATIGGLQQQIDALHPTRWQTKRAQYAGQIQYLQQQNMQMIREQREYRASGEGSSTGETFERLAEFGVSRFGFAVYAAFLLDLIPFVTCLIIGGLLARNVHSHVARDHDRYRFATGSDVPVKKSQPLRRAA